MSWHRAEVHRQRAAVLEARGRYDEAIDAYREALRCDPEAADAQLRIGLLLRELGRDEEANQAFAAADKSSDAAFASAGAWSLNGLAGFTNAAGNPVDPAVLAGAFGALVDQLMGETAPTADDAAPVAGRRVTSEADDLAATLEGPGDSDESESDETWPPVPAPWRKATSASAIRCAATTSWAC